MATNWYYVQGSERIGPISVDKLKLLFDEGKLNNDSYVWCKEYKDWAKIKDVEQLKYFCEISEVSEDESSESQPLSDDGRNQITDIPIIEMDPLGDRIFDWDVIDFDERAFTIKVGIDRGENEAEYGPFSLNQISSAFKEKRINGKSLIFSPGMEDWIFLADLPIYKKLFKEQPPAIEDEDRRKNVRKPFVARMLFHDRETLFEGICRDISVGGMQIMVSCFEGSIGEEVNMNVHPDNSDHVFVASGKIVRILDGKQGFSIRFTGLGSQAKQSIMSYIDHAI